MFFEKVGGKKNACARVFHHTGLLWLARQLGSASFVVLNYHRIRPDEADFQSSFDNDVFGPSASELESQVAWLSSNANLISEEVLLDCLENGSPLPERAAMLTFDDGYRDNFTLAYPILKRYRAPAIFFVPTDAIDERRLGWWDVIAYLIQNTENTVLNFGRQIFPLSGDRRGTIEYFLRQMKLQPEHATRDLIDRLAQACEVAPPKASAQDAELMTWEQIREMRRHGLAIGSHTRSHRVLATLDSETQRHELEHSRARLEAELGEPVRSLSYPVGGYEHFSDETRALAAACGYRAAFSFNTGANRREGLSRYDIKRVSAPSRSVLLYAVSSLPAVFAA